MESFFSSIRTLLLQVTKHPGFWTTVGVIIGFSLGELSRVLREKFILRRLRENLEDELESNIFIIAQKQDIIRQVIAGLQNNQVLTAQSVHSASLIYENHLASLGKLLTPIQRDNIHWIYQCLKHNDNFLDDFEKNIKEDIRLGIMGDPWNTYIDRLDELNQNYEVIKPLIRNYLNKSPRDVFYRHSGQKEPPRKFVGKPVK